MTGPVQTSLEKTGPRPPVLSECNRLHDVEVTVAYSSTDFNMLCGTFVGPGTANQLVVVECQQNTRGRYVRLQIVKGNNNYLTLCDVKVIGF
ncbi:hypothetical protein FSP39_008412 [Pinctada imbricata]|uniref:Uncharacterized protein n=1 Tax=Pinctada imbricata TaxID=66713 RepID=A0AA89C8M6_PINIB|nr:hypothetical protein FSP39_008412 [Pinctada imbricata]